jgi:hypothetical protein
MVLTGTPESNCDSEGSYSTLPSSSPQTEKLVNGLPALYLRELLGDGPLRFALRDSCDWDEILDCLSSANGREFDQLQKLWKAYCRDKIQRCGKSNGSEPSSRNLPPPSLPIEWYFRYLNHCIREDESFAGEQAFHNMTKTLKNDRYLKLRVFALQAQLESKTLFPVPGLKTSEGHSMFYMRPSRYFPKKTSTKTIIDNLVYVMNTMLESNVHSQKKGIGFLACMDDWAMKNFDVNYCFQFMLGLQGAMVPVKVQLFLIVNPPAWFGAIWQIMKPMLLPSFRRKVKIVKEQSIGKYLQADYLDYLPDDMESGIVPTEDLVADFVTYRRYVERADAPNMKHNSPAKAQETHFDPTDHSDIPVEIDIGKHLPCSGKMADMSTTLSYCDTEEDAFIEIDIEHYDKAEISREIDEYFVNVGW